MKFKHNGIEIKCNKDGRFEYEIDGESESTSSLKEAEVEIDNHLKAQAKAKVEKINLPIINENGTVFSVVGVHGSSGKIITDPKDKDQWGATNYARNADTERLVPELLAARKVVDKIEADLAKYTVNTDRNSYGRPTVDQIVNIVSKLKENHALAMQGKSK